VLVECRTTRRHFLELAAPVADLSAVSRNVSERYGEVVREGGSVAHPPALRLQQPLLALERGSARVHAGNSADYRLTSLLENCVLLHQRGGPPVFGGIVPGGVLFRLEAAKGLVPASREGAIRKSAFELLRFELRRRRLLVSPTGIVETRRQRRALRGQRSTLGVDHHLKRETALPMFGGARMYLHNAPV